MTDRSPFPARGVLGQQLARHTVAFATVYCCYLQDFDPAASLLKGHWNVDSSSGKLQ